MDNTLDIHNFHSHNYCVDNNNNVLPYDNIFLHKYNNAYFLYKLLTPVPRISTFCFFPLVVLKIVQLPLSITKLTIIALLILLSWIATVVPLNVSKIFSCKILRLSIQTNFYTSFTEKHKIVVNSYYICLDGRLCIKLGVCIIIIYWISNLVHVHIP